MKNIGKKFNYFKLQFKNAKNKGRFIFLCVVGFLLLFLGRQQIQLVDSMTPKLPVVMIIPYGGRELPFYSKYFLESVEKSGIDVKFISLENNTISIDEKYSTINQIYLNDNFVQFVADKLCKAYYCNSAENENMYRIIEKRLEDAYKLCELRPMLAYIFEEYTKDYKYVAFSDIDIVWGNTTDFMAYFDEDFDIVSVSSTDIDRLYLRGQFSAMKNNRNVTLAFTQAFPKEVFFDMWSGSERVTEEGAFSHYMVSSTYKIIVIPFQSTDWTCQFKQIVVRDGVLTCDAVELDSPSAILHGKYKSLPAHSFDVIRKPECSTNWIPERFRSCIETKTVGITIIQNSKAKIYQFNKQQENTMQKFPLFHHFQLTKFKNYFTLHTE